MKKILTILLCVACLCANAQNNGKAAPKKVLPKKAAPYVKPTVVEPTEVKNDDECIYKAYFLMHLPVIIPVAAEQVAVNLGSEGGFFTLRITNKSVFNVECASIEIYYNNSEGYPVDSEKYTFENISSGATKTKKINFEKGRKVQADLKGCTIKEIDLDICR